MKAVIAENSRGELFVHRGKGNPKKTICNAPLVNGRLAKTTDLQDGVITIEEREVDGQVIKVAVVCPVKCAEKEARITKEKEDRQKAINRKKELKASIATAESLDELKAILKELL